MKKAAAILILLVIVFQMIGVFLLFKAKQIEIRQEVKMRIKTGVPESELTVLTFDTPKINELKWIKDYEFSYKGQMYDIVETRVVNNKIIYLCLPDYQETKLFKNLNKIVGNELGKDKSNSNSKTSVFANWFCINGFQFHFNSMNIFKSINTNYQFSESNRNSIPDPPPPRYF